VFSELLNRVGFFSRSLAETKLCSLEETLPVLPEGLIRGSRTGMTGFDDGRTEVSVVAEGEVTRPVFVKLVGSFSMSRPVAPLLSSAKSVFSELLNRVGFFSRSLVETKLCSLEETLSVLPEGLIRGSRTGMTGLDDGCTEGVARPSLVPCCIVGMYPKKL
jgi:hypothetical protein